MTEENKNFKMGYAVLVGRPNVGKSTLLNALVGHKVSIVSPKAQTTRSQITAYLEEERGQIFFLDTPGYYDGKGVSKYNNISFESLKQADIILYVVDHSRAWGKEDSIIWERVVDVAKPTILVINKSDVKQPEHTDEYLVQCEDDVVGIVSVSAAMGHNLGGLKEMMFDQLPVQERDVSVDDYVTPLLSMNSKEYLAEIIREKVYLHTGQELPYQTRVRVNYVDEYEAKNRINIGADIIISEERYKPMLIGANAKKVRQIRLKATKELEFMTDKEVCIKLQVVVEK